MRFSVFLHKTAERNNNEPSPFISTLLVCFYSKIVDENLFSTYNTVV